jgi:hypothetical protein
MLKCTVTWTHKSQLGAQFILSIFIRSIFINLYMFRATTCPSSGVTIVFMRHLVLVILCGWLSGIHSTVHTRQSSVQNKKYQVSHIYTYILLSPDDEHVGARKRVEIDKYIKKNCSPSWLYLQNYTGMHGQQNIKLVIDPIRKVVTINLRNSQFVKRGLFLSQR